MRHDIEVADENAAGSGIRAGSTYINFAKITNIFPFPPLKPKSRCHTPAHTYIHTYPCWLDGSVAISIKANYNQYRLPTMSSIKCDEATQEEPARLDGWLLAGWLAG